MSPLRTGAAGATRVCPHCRQTILESATVCPACRHHLKVGLEAKARSAALFTPLRVEGTIEHPGTAAPWEYSVLLVVRNDSGAEIVRHVAGVGVMHPAERRSFTVAVEVFQPK